MESPYLFTLQQALKVAYFTGCTLKVRIISVYRLVSHVDMFYAHHPVRVAIDSGATENMIRHTFVQLLGCQETPRPNPSSKQMSHLPCTLSVRHASLLSVKAILLPSKALSSKS